MSSARGFTFIELIVIMSVMAIFSAVAIPRLIHHQALREMGFQDRLHAMLRYARMVAVAQQRPVCVSLISVPAPQFEMTYVSGSTCGAAAVAEPGADAPFVLPSPAGLTFSGASVVRFDAEGRPARFNGVGVLVPDGHQDVTVGVRLLRVSRETGYVYWP